MNTFTFRAVGQGLFYTGSLAKYSYNFVFDCGGISGKQYIEREINNFCTEISSANGNNFIDFAAISHLHVDHFNGLYYLLKHARVNKLYLPFIDDDKVVVKFILAFAVFADYNNKQIDDENIKLYKLMLKLYGVDEDYRLENDIQIPEVIIINNKPQPFNYDKPAWQFVLINKTRKSDKIATLKNQLRNFYFDNKIDNQHTLLDFIQERETNITLLKQIYEGVFGKSNLNFTSTILLHYPLYDTISRYLTFKDKSISPCNCFFIQSEKTATLLTGDGDCDFYYNDIIKALSNRELFLLQVPHHGAKSTWNNSKKILSLNIDCFVIPFGLGNLYNHPSKGVIDDLNNCTFLLATQQFGFSYYIS